MHDHVGVGFAGSPDTTQSTQTLPGYFVLSDPPQSPADNAPTRQFTLPAQAASAAAQDTSNGSPTQPAENVFNPLIFTAGLFPGKPHRPASLCLSPAAEPANQLERCSKETVIGAKCSVWTGKTQTPHILHPPSGHALKRMYDALQEIRHIAVDSLRVWCNGLQRNCVGDVQLCRCHTQGKMT